jgi:YHS domain-containing protein
VYRDPHCGTHVPAELSFPLERAGEVIHFCSAECRTRYQQSSQRAASA